MLKASGEPNQHFVVDRWFDILKGEPPRMVDAPILHHYILPVMAGSVGFAQIWPNFTVDQSSLAAD